MVHLGQGLSTRDLCFRWEQDFGNRVSPISFIEKFVVRVLEKERDFVKASFSVKINRGLDSCTLEDVDSSAGSDCCEPLIEVGFKGHPIGGHGQNMLPVLNRFRLSPTVSFIQQFGHTLKFQVGRNMVKARLARKLGNGWIW